MRKTIILALLTILSTVAVACSPSGGSRSASAECVEPSNPYNDEGGHSAGFRWAQETGGECPSDHGQSFEEGCQDYYNQRYRYDECEAARAK